ncbi:MAG: hypothetical protein HWN81_04705 [Candidatus Lokiarchaeota archaeon]|nr:hypothetical protein [Candidatus Lokiarchaeota archaeon]
MHLFEWIRDIQTVYENLISNAKNINLKEIETFREDQDKKFDIFISKINVLVNTALGNLAVDIDGKTNIFEKKLNNALKNIELEFQKNIEDLEKLIIEEVGLDF